MRTEDHTAPRRVHLSDYAPPPWLVDSVDLLFDLKPEATTVRARLSFRRNPEGAPGPAPLRLDGRGLTLEGAAIDGAPVPAEALRIDAEGLTVEVAALPGDSFLWEARTILNPEANTALEGLYRSGGLFCTQCEAEGFRKITYFPDRPDVMAVYDVRIEADRAACPVLLSNGDPAERGALPDGRHYAVWRDPHRKPCYLFALVAGDLRANKRRLVTASGREVELAIWVRPGDEGKTDYALDALERSMRWDEAEYGREYDLDVFNVVAVADFNMGAMENKGLNIFNSKYVLASPETATDRDYELIESIIAHEYFHNWTGNRITCRDWFQLCLKEGLTVFRDQQFSSDMRGAAVKRIDDVRRLRAMQFREDDGPLAHPVRPESYAEINNFYTATVYEKGAEIIGMLRALVGAETYRRALDLYFERHDGQACAIEDFRACFEDASGRDLSAFARWWSQAGTPRLSVSEDWDAEAGRYALTFRQETPPTPGQPEKTPVTIPVRLGLVGPDGAEMLAEGERVIVVGAAEHVEVFDGLAARPAPSLLRGFSAPVRLEHAISDEERAFLMAHDADAFNRWEAGRAFATDVLLRMIGGGAPEPRFVSALCAMAADGRLDPAFRAMALDLPSEEDLAQEIAARGGVVDPQAVFAAREALIRAAAEAERGLFLDLYERSATPGPYAPDAAAAGKRALRNRALAYLTAPGDAAGFALAARQFETADNMTEQAPALSLLVHRAAPEAEAALAAFYERWKADALVVDKWFAIQAAAPAPGALDRVRALTAHPAFNWLNPNRFRALIGAFAMGAPSRFHEPDGAAYAFYADWLLKLDARNPQVAARLAGGFETWRRYDEGRRALILAQLRRILGEPGLSKDMRDIIDRLMEGEAR